MRPVLPLPPLLPVLLMAACHTVPLSEVVVAGGTPEQRESLELELDAFDAFIGTGRLELREVTLVDELRSDDTLGRYHGYRGRGHIEILDAAPSITLVLRHELCHALDYAENLMKAPDAVFDELAAGQFSIATQARLESNPTRAKQRHEAFAELCEIGPTAAAAVTHSCDGDPPLAAEASAYLLDEVYVAYDPPPLLTVVSTPVTLDAWPPQEPIVSATLVPTTVQILGDSDGWQRQADLYTGQLTEGAHGLLDRPPTPPLARGVRLWQAVGLPEGPAAMHGDIPLDHLGVAHRTWVFDPAYEDWRLLDDSCEEPEGKRLFLADDQVWRAWTETNVLRWQLL